MSLRLAFLATMALSMGADISLQSQTIDIIVEDRYAFANYSFYFVNTNTETPAELSYEISLQSDTFISYFIAELNGLIFRGKTKEKEAAQTEYNNAVELGLNAVLVSQDHDANVFNIKTNIQQSGEAKLTITTERFMLRRFGYYELSLLVDNIYSNIDSQFTNSNISITLFDENNISYTDIIASTNAHYNIQKVSTNQYDIDINLENSANIQQELILLRYKTETMQNRHQLLYDAQSLTFMHIFSYEDETTLPRRVIFILDKSGSMGTIKWESAVAATIGAINNLRAGTDRFNVILFNSTSTFYSEAIVSVTGETMTDSVNWINEHTSGGSTNIYQSVIDAINLIKEDTVESHKFDYVNQIVLITDGEPTYGVTDPIEIQNGLFEANNNLLEPASASIFCLGIGSDYGNDWVTDLDYPLLRSIATQNGGFDVRVKQSETETILTEYYNILQSPLLSYIVLTYNSYNTVVGDANNVNMLTQNKYRGLYAGTDIVVCGKVGNINDDGIVISLFGRRGGSSVSNTFAMEISNDAEASNNNVVVDRIWAYLRLKMYRRLLDNPRLAIFDVDAFESNALALALTYELVTQWTSMIVVDERIVNDNMSNVHITNGNVHINNVQNEMDGDIRSMGGNYYDIGDMDDMDDMDDMAEDVETKDSINGCINLYVCRMALITVLSALSILV